LIGIFMNLDKLFQTI